MMVYVTQGCAAMGINLYGAFTMANRIKEAGLINVTERILKIPTVLDGLQGIALGPLCRGLGWSGGAHGPPRLLLVCNHIRPLSFYAPSIPPMHPYRSSQKRPYRIMTPHSIMGPAFMNQSPLFPYDRVRIHLPNQPVSCF